MSLTAVALVTALSYTAALWVSAGLTWPPVTAVAFLVSAGSLMAVRCVAASVCGLGAQRWRYVGPREVRRLAIAVAVGSAFYVPFIQVLDLVTPIELSVAASAVVLLLEPLLTILFAAALWVGYRTAYETAKRSERISLDDARVLVVGAGEAGEALVRHMIFHSAGYYPVAFVDDDWSRQGTLIHEVEVMGGTEDLAEVAERTGAEEIVIAVPSAHPGDLRRIVGRCQSTGLPFRVLPHMAEVLDGDVSLSQLREVQIEDLLGREPISLELPELARELRGRTVLITGAAGSIGSELSRQVAINQPAELVVFDQSETGLFFLELELRELAPSVKLSCVVGDVVDAGSVKRVFDRHQPDWVFHAAAYKHVPMMETNEREALRNNVVGTWRVADAAGRHGVQRFVLVSTDKAVRPANVMGASKRAAEIVMLELQEAFPETSFGAVRFGNVLGSAGSVIPVFKRQLEAGQPLTVTHQDVTRYFMTIPEASQLVLQASLLPELQGRIAMLEMGEPVRILDLARTLIRLSGGRSGSEPIVITGLRPGEKLHEQLVAPEEEVDSTQIPKVNLLAQNPSALTHGLLTRIGRWDHLLTVWSLDRVMEELMTIVPSLREHRGETRLVPVDAGVPDTPAMSWQSRAPDTASIRRRKRRRSYPYPYGKPGFIDRRNPCNRPADLSKIPLRRAA
ncbi:MAG: nucleoside-diphosphate sugar epimerase/dehydratase, partial [Gemmatimonadota bacterium]